MGKKPLNVQIRMKAFLYLINKVLRTLPMSIFCFRGVKEGLSRVMAHAYDRQTNSVSASCYQEPAGCRSLFRGLVV